MDNERKSELKAQYKEMVFEAGVFQIRNKVSGKVFIGSSKDIKAMFNRFRAQLDFNSCRIKDLQDDWKTLGAEQFVFETLDVLEPEKGEREVDSDEVAELEKLWLEKVQPWGEKGYNQQPK